MLTNNKQKHKKIFVILIFAILFVFVCVGYLYISRNLNSESKITSEPTKIDGINYNPPTEEEKKAADEIKEEIVSKEQQKTEVATQDGKIVANIAVTSYDLQEVRAYVSNVIEEDGECIATFKQGETIITRISKGFANVSYTQCEPIVPNLPNSNSWETEVEYISSKSYGKSSKVEIKQ